MTDTTAPARIARLRNVLHRVDMRLVELLVQRSRIVQGIQSVKQEIDLPLRDEMQEAAVVERAVEYFQTRGGVYHESTIRQLFEMICDGHAGIE